MDYFNAINTGAVLDIQPVRDLSYLIDLKLGGIFYLTNFVFLIILSLQLSALLDQRLGVNNRLKKLALVAFFVFSPVVMSSVGWIAARKHLLSTLFILQALIEVNKNLNARSSKKGFAKIIIYYFLSVLSQPINVLFPLSAVWISLKNKSKDWLQLKIFLIASSLLWAGINFYYYQSRYVTQTAGDGKFTSGAMFDFALSARAFGRYVFSTLIPTDYVLTPLSSESLKNEAGLILFFLILIFFGVLKKRKYLDSFVLFVVPLLPVLILPTRIFASQSYLLTSFVAYVLFLSELLNEYKKTIWLLCFLIVVNLSCSIHYVLQLGDSDKISNFSNKKERTMMSTMGEVERLVGNKDHNAAKKELEELKKYKTPNRYLPYLVAKNIYTDISISDEEKIELLQKEKIDTPYVDLILALLYSNSHQSEMFKRKALSVYKDPARYIDHSYLNNEKVLALYRVGCEKNKIEKECKQVFEQFEKNVSFQGWNQERYSEYYRNIKKDINNLEYK